MDALNVLCFTFFTALFGSSLVPSSQGSNGVFCKCEVFAVKKKMQ